MRITTSAWRYLMFLQFLPAALFALALWYVDGKAAAMQAASCRMPGRSSADRAELLLQLVRTEELQRQAQHQVDALLQ